MLASSLFCTSNVGCFLPHYIARRSNSRMNSLKVQRRIPLSMRSLLTDIAPKQEWTETELDSKTRDGIMLPSRGATCGQGAFLTPAETREEKGTEDCSKASRRDICMLCKYNPSCYTCPRCNLHYCGLTCYQSPDHSVCSEEFYKESVLQELKDMGTTESEGRKKMHEILASFRQKAERNDGGIESLLKEDATLSGDTDVREEQTKEKVLVLQYLSRLAELQQSGEESTVENEAILRKLEEIVAEKLPEDLHEEAACAEEDLDLADRFSGLDIDKLSEEEMWELLNSKEKDKFMDLIKGGVLGSLVPLWKPWWEEHEEGGRALVEVLEEEVSKVERENSSTTDELGNHNTFQTSEEVLQNCGRKISKGKGSSTASNVPPITAKIPKLNSLCANPSPVICYGLVNALYAYTFTVCLFNNDMDSLMFEFCDMILALSEALNTNRIFNSVQEALDCGETLILRGGYLDREDPLATIRALEAVAHIMTGRDGKDATGYCLASLSHLRSFLSQARKALSKEGEEGERRQKYFLASKKCEFFQAWSYDNAEKICTLAIELWNEHNKRECLRSNMEKAKTAVGSMNKVKCKQRCKLIEEIK